MRQVGAAIEGLTGDPCGDGSALHLDSVNTQVVTLSHCLARYYYGRKVGLSIQDFSMLFLITACEPQIISK